MTHNISDYLAMMAEKGGSDLYLTVGMVPSLRVDNMLISLDSEALTKHDMISIVKGNLTPAQVQIFEDTSELNTSIDLGEGSRFRVNVMRQRGVPAIVIRRINNHIPSFAELGLPQTLERLSLLKRGLILITGMTGSGKSTSLAAMIDYRNKREPGHIVTIEDPIEFFHDHQKSIISQREVGADTNSYAVALKNVLRQRPDMIMVGEIRDREVMEQGLLVAETGHLCLSTLHTSNTYQAIERIINFFPEDYHDQIRLNLALNLRAIISQRLVPSKTGALRLVPEIMINEGLIKELIHEGKITKIREVMEQNRTQGMCTFDQSLLDLYVTGVITEEVALTYADMPGDLRIKMKQVPLRTGGGSSAGPASRDVSSGNTAGTGKPAFSAKEFPSIDITSLSLNDLEKTSSNF